MRKPKPPRRPRLIRKWDGTPVNATDASGQPIPPEEPGLSHGMSHSMTSGREVTSEIEREEELTDTFER